MAVRVACDGRCFPLDDTRIFGTKLRYRRESLVDRINDDVKRVAGSSERPGRHEATRSTVGDVQAVVSNVWYCSDQLSDVLVDQFVFFW